MNGNREHPASIKCEHEAINSFFRLSLFAFILAFLLLSMSVALAVDVNSEYYTSWNPYYPEYGLPNCTCFAWGRAYEAFGKRPKLSTGNGCDFWGYNQSHNYYPYGSEPRPGSIACWYGTGPDGNCGHVAFVESVSGNNVTISQSGWGWRYENSSMYGTIWETKTINKNNMGSIQSNFQGYIYLEDLSSDHTAPTITQSRVGSISPNGITILATATDNTYVNSIEIGVWHSEMSISDAKWYSVSAQNNKEVQLYIPFSDCVNRKGVTYYINIRAWDFAGNNSEIARVANQFVEDILPVVTSATIENITPMGYDVVCAATDNVGVSFFRIGTWHNNISVDNAVWQEKVSDGSRTVIHVSVASFDYAQDVIYHTNVYACDTSGNYSEPVRAGNPFIERDISGLVTVTNVSTAGYDLVVSAADYPSAAGLRIGSWNDEMSIDNAVWQNYDSPTGTLHVSTADLGSAINTTYHTNLYISKASGGYSTPLRACDIFIENTPPIISSASIENITPDGYDIRCRTSDNSKVARIRVGTWHDQMSIDDAVWQTVWNPEEETVIHVSIQSFGNKRDVTYHSNVFAFDECNNVSEVARAGDPYLEATCPVIKTAKIQSYINEGRDGYKVYVKVSDNKELSKIYAGTWNDATGKSKIKWQSATVSGTSAEKTFSIKVSDFSNARNTTYHTEVYAVDAAGNESNKVQAADYYVAQWYTLTKANSVNDQTEVITPGYPAGTEVAITAEAIDGYAFDHWICDKGTIKKATSASTVFFMPQAAATLTCVYKKIECTITIDGKTMPDRSCLVYDLVQDGASVPFTISCNTNTSGLVNTLNVMAQTWDFNTSLTVNQSAKTLTFHGSGIANISAKAGEYGGSNWMFLVMGNDTLRIPQGTTTIEEEAFANTKASIVVIPDSVTSIGSKAFTNVKIVLMDTSISRDIAADAFPNLFVYAETGTQFNTALYQKFTTGLYLVSRAVELPATTAKLDVSGSLDGTNVGNTRGYGTFDVYIDGKLLKDDVDDINASFPLGTSYQITDIKPAEGHQYNGVVSGSTEGVIRSTKSIVIRLSFSTIE